MTVFHQLTEPAVVAALRSGAVGVLPGDTVYGLMASAGNPDAVTKLFQLKQRENKPGTVIAASVDQLVELGLKRRYLTAVEQYWPGPVSVIIPVDNREELNYLHQGLYGLAVRIPKDDQLLKLLQETGPLMTSSANLAGQPTSTTLRQAQEYFGEKADFYVEGGDLSDRLPSTVIRIIDDAVEVVRQGAVIIDQD